MPQLVDVETRSLSAKENLYFMGEARYGGDKLQDDSILSRRVQIYRSTSTNPYLNLSIEHHLLQRSHPDSTVLFLYANRPCVVIGRNQNPWLEVNLRQLARGIHNVGDEPLEVALVRRRSGGGTVFHDLGNLNWSVICPSAVFNRDRHAEMVSRALRGLGVSSAHVNERHDIVVDATSSDGHVQQFKVSGSAYKVTRLRSLHHGTLLLSSPHLPHVSGLLRSPAESFIKARGVESVRSKIRNVNVGNDEFVEGVVGEFRRMYDGERVAGITLIDQDAAAETPNIAQGVRELMAPEWIYGQTPKFTFSSYTSISDQRPRPPLPASLPQNFRCHFVVERGEITSSCLRYTDNTDTAGQDVVICSLTENRVHRVRDWKATLKAASPMPTASSSRDSIGDWLNAMFGTDP